MAKKGQIFRNRSSEFKLSVIMDMREHRLGLVETAKKYGVDHHSVTRGSAYSWKKEPKV